jgi:hypothetical protein
MPPTMPDATDVVPPLTADEIAACRRLGCKLLRRHPDNPRLRLAGLVVVRLADELARAARREADRARMREARRRAKEEGA